MLTRSVVWFLWFFPVPAFAIGPAFWPFPPSLSPAANARLFASVQEQLDSSEGEYGGCQFWTSRYLARQGVPQILSIMVRRPNGDVRLLTLTDNKNEMKTAVWAPARAVPGSIPRRITFTTSRQIPAASGSEKELTNVFLFGFFQESRFALEEFRVEVWTRPAEKRPTKFRIRDSFVCKRGAAPLVSHGVRLPS